MTLFGTAALLFDRRLQRVIVQPLSRFTQELDALRQGHEPVNTEQERDHGLGNCSELWSLHVHFSHMREAVGEREAFMRSREEDLRTTFHSIGDGVISTDSGGLITRMNPAAQELTSWGQEEAQALPLTQVLKLFNDRTGKGRENLLFRVLYTGKQQELTDHRALRERGQSSCFRQRALTQVEEQVIPVIPSGNPSGWEQAQRAR
ncbi:MAG: PAS domain-containing protein [Desulfohalobiaceae bacterium]